MDVGGFEGRGRNALAVKGLDDAEDGLAVEGRVFVSRSAADYRRNLSAAARQGYALVIANGVAMSGALSAVARQHPASRFAIVDVSRYALAGRPQNVRGLVFAEEEVGYLAGAAAALASRTHIVSSVAGRHVPRGTAFPAGFRAGAQRTVAGTKVQTGYASTLSGPSSCKAVALRQIAAGSDSVVAEARPCGAGALEAARQKGRWGIGIGTDQSFHGRHILTSVVKQVDVAVYQAIASVDGGAFGAGGDLVLTVRSGGIGFGEVSRDAPPTFPARLTSILAAIKAGKLTPPRR